MVREVKKQHGALPGHMLFSNMPPLEAAKILCSELATRKTSNFEREPATLGVCMISHEPISTERHKERST